MLISIETDNSAFEDGNGGGYELARIFRKLADESEQFSGDFSGYKIKDTNGNTVGQFQESGDVKIIVCVEEGLVQKVKCNDPAEVLLFDYDTEGTDDDDRIIKDDGGREAWLSYRDAEHDPEGIEATFRHLRTIKAIE